GGPATFITLAAWSALNSRPSRASAYEKPPNSSGGWQRTGRFVRCGGRRPYFLMMGRVAFVSPTASCPSMTPSAHGGDFGSPYPGPESLYNNGSTPSPPVLT